MTSSAHQPDLFEVPAPHCASCPHLDAKPIDSGLRYCWGEMSWRWSTDRVGGCVYRDRVIQRPVRERISRADILRDFQENPKHDPSPKDRRWLRAELRKEERAA